MDFMQGVGFLALVLIIWLIIMGLSAFMSIDMRDDTREKDE
jgi:hypothetical protein